MRTSRVERECVPLVALLPSLSERIRVGRVEEGPLRLGVEEVPLRLECVAPGTPREMGDKNAGLYN